MLLSNLKGLKIVFNEIYVMPRRKCLVIDRTITVARLKQLTVEIENIMNHKKRKTICVPS